MVANGTGTWNVTPNVTVPPKTSYLLPASNGTIVFTDAVNTFFGCDCKSSNNTSGTNIVVLPAANRVLTNLLYESDTAAVNISIPFTAYVILGADTVIKKQLVFPDPIYQYGIVPLDGCLTKL